MATRLGKGYIELSAKDRALHASFAAIEGKTRGLTGSMGGLASALGGVWGKVALIAAAVSGGGVKAFASFEQQMANVSTMLDEQSMKYLPAMGKSIKKMSVEFGEGTATLTGGLYDVLSASFAASKGIDALTVSSKAAVAGMTDTKTAADVITTVINAYGMEVEQAAEVSDKLFAIVKRGKTTFPELASALGRVVGVASEAGISFEEIGASVATLTRAGIDTNEAMTGVRGIMTAFLKPSEEGGEMARRFGFELSSLSLKTIGLMGVMKKLAGISIDDLAVLAPNLKGITGFAGVLGQLEGNLKDYDTIMKSAGMTQVAFNKMANTLTFQSKRLWMGIKVIGIELGSVFAPALRKGIDFLLMAGAAMDNWGKSLEEKFGVISKLGNLFSDVMGVMKSAWGGLFAYIAPVFDAFVSAYMAGVSVIVDTWVGAWGFIKDVASSVWGVIGGKMTGWFTEFRDRMKWMMRVVEFGFKNWESIAAWTFTAISYRAVQFFNTIKWFFTNTMPEALSWFGRNWKEVFIDAFNMTKAIFVNLGKNIWNFFKAIQSWMSGDGFDFKWTSLTEGFKSAIEELPEFTDRPMGELEKKLKNQMDVIGGHIKKEFEEFVETKVAEDLAKDLAAKSAVEDVVSAGVKKEVGAAGAAGAKAGGAGGGMVGLTEMWNKIAEKGLASEQLTETKKQTEIQKVSRKESMEQRKLAYEQRKELIVLGKKNRGAVLSSR